MVRAKNINFEDDPTAIFDEEDEETLASIDLGIKDADEGRVVTMEEARRRMAQWATKSSLLKSH